MDLLYNILVNQSNINWKGYNYYFIDTPGLDDGIGDDKNIKEIIDIKKNIQELML